MLLSYSDVSVVASVAISTLDRIGVTACFVGGMACKLYGNERTPEVCFVASPAVAASLVLVPRLLRLRRGSRYLVPWVPMGPGRTKATSRRSEPLVLPLPVQKTRRHI